MSFLAAREDDDILTFVYLDSEMRMVSIVGGF